MLPTSVRTRAAVLMAATLVLTGLGGAGSAGAAQPGELVIAPTFGPPAAETYVTTPQHLMGSTEAIAYEHSLDASARDGVLLHPLGSVPASAAVNLQGLLSVVGDQLVGYSTDTPSEVTAVSISTGARQALEPGPDNPATFDPTSTPHLTLTGTGGGWLDRDLGDATTPDYLTLHDLVGGPSGVYPLPAAGEHVEGVQADAEGMLAYLSGYYVSPNLSYLDFRSGRWTRIATYVDVSALSPQDVAWVADGAIKRLHRADLAAAPEERTVGGTVTAVAITDTATAWIADGQLATAAEPSTSAAVTVGQSAAGQVVATGDESFAARLGAGTATEGIYAVTAGSPTVGALLQQTAFGPVNRLRLSPGLQRFSVGGADYAQSLTTAAGHVVAGPLQAVPGGEVAATDGNRTVVEGAAGPIATLTVNGVWTQPLVISVPFQLGGAQLSGTRLLVRQGTDATSDGPLPLDVLYDLSRPGLRPTNVPSTSALSGHWLAYALHDGSVWLRDLALPRSHDRQLRGPGPAPSLTVDYTRLFVSADWVVWDAQPVGGVTAYAAAYQISTGRTTDLTLPGTAQALADGLLAWVDDGNGIHLLSLATGADQLVDWTNDGVALSPDYLAYIDEDYAEHVVPVAALDRTGPRAVFAGGDPIPRTAAVTLAHPLAESYTVSRPLTRWAFVVRNGKGKVVFSSKGAAPTGAVSVRWNGRASKGRHLAAGRYRWTLSGAGPGGALVGQDGHGKLTGVVRVTG